MSVVSNTMYSFASETRPRVSPMPCFAFVFCVFVFLYFLQRNKTNRLASSPLLSVKDMFPDLRGCLKPQIVLDPIYILLFFPKYTYL